MTAVAPPRPFAGAATGIGSWPGSDPREAAATVVGELPALPHLVELPDRGVGADLLGRTGALLVDLYFDTTTRGYRLAARPGAAARRAHSLLREDLDALEEAWETAGLRGGVVKVQAAGPLTLAAQVELAGGHRALTDRGAVRDFAESLAEGLGRHRDEVARRLGAEVVVQLDEPSLPAVLAGGLSGVSRLDTVPAVPEPEALAVLDAVIAGVGGPVGVHCCAAGVPWDLLRRSHADAVLVDLAHVDAAALDGIGEFLDSGADLVLGLIPTKAPTPAPTWRDAAAPALTLLDRVGFPRTVLRERVGVSPACGLGRAAPAWARTCLRLAGEVARAFAEDPESL
ncbi:MAG: methionine synthase [Mycobacteriaceae bacterium]|nr:methionine synthase [Mycobacteriaceae bacterium]